MQKFKTILYKQRTITQPYEKVRTDTHGNTNKPQNITSSEMSQTQDDIYDSTFKKYLEITKKEHRIHLQGLRKGE